LRKTCNDRTLREQTMRPPPFLRAFFLAAALMAPPVIAEPSAKAFLMAKQGELTALVKNASPANGKKVEAIFDKIIDYEALARESLARHWEARTEAERAEFTSVLKELVRRAYRKNLDKTAGYDVAYEGESKIERGHLIKTVARSKTNAREEPFAIDYLVNDSGGTWRITDIVTEGSSMVINYRRQFNKVIDKDGFAELMRRMKRKLEER
jgi:phospholipid transport system substrate-binding protein